MEQKEFAAHDTEGGEKEGATFEKVVNPPTGDTEDTAQVATAGVEPKKDEDSGPVTLERKEE